jgi:hypothetical protein
MDIDRNRKNKEIKIKRYIDRDRKEEYMKIDMIIKYEIEKNIWMEKDKDR